MAKEDAAWLKALKAEAKRLGKTVHELLVEKNMAKAMKEGKMKAAIGGMAVGKSGAKKTPPTERKKLPPLINGSPTERKKLPPVMDDAPLFGNKGKGKGGVRTKGTPSTKTQFATALGGMLKGMAKKGF
jgi:hypothetical protein